MATKEEIKEFNDALADMRKRFPELATRLGVNPDRPALLELLAEFSPDIAAGLKVAGKVTLLRLIMELAPEKKAAPLVSFTTRLPEDVVQAVKVKAIESGQSVQEIVAELLTKGLREE